MNFKIKKWEKSNQCWVDIFMPHLFIFKLFSNVSEVIFSQYNCSLIVKTPTYGAFVFVICSSECSYLVYINWCFSLSCLKWVSEPKINLFDLTFFMKIDNTRWDEELHQNEFNKLMLPCTINFIFEKISPVVLKTTGWIMKVRVPRGTWIPLNFQY